MLPKRTPGAAFPVSALLLCACGADSTGITEPGFSLAVTAPPATTLGTVATFVVEVRSTSHSGAVTLGVTGAPSDWTITFDPDASVSVPEGGSTSVAVHVTVPSDGTAAPSGRVLTLAGSGSSGSVSASANVTVANEYVMAIVAGAGSGAHWGVHGGTTVLLRAGAVLRFLNHDTTGHIVHAGSGIPGLQHQDNSAPLALGQSFAATVGAGTDDVYCHAHEAGSGQVRFVVQ